MMKILKTLINVEFAIMFMLMMTLKKEIFFISLENIEYLHIEIVISKSNQIIKFLSYSRT